MGRKGSGRLLIALLLGLTACGGVLGAVEVDGSLSFGGADADAQARFLAALLSPGEGATGEVRFALPAEQAGRDDAGRWTPGALQTALVSLGALSFRGDADRASAAAPSASWAPAPLPQEARITAQGLPRVLLLENSATISPLSKGLSRWAWPYTLKSFADAEADPGRLFDPRAVDLVVVESPAGWGSGDEPSGPSQMGEATAAALRDYVRHGGAALFLDISQWDVNKAWRQSLSLEPVGPYAVSKLSFFRGPRGGISLSNFGEVAAGLRRRDAFSLLGSENFDFADGSVGPVYAAWAMPDPEGGTGWVSGLAFHVFEQDHADSLAGSGQRLLLNLLLLSGAGRVHVEGVAARDIPTAVPTPLPTAAPPTPPPTPTPTPLPTSPPPSPTPLPTLAQPTPEPTLPPATPQAPVYSRPLPPQEPYLMAPPPPATAWVPTPFVALPPPSPTALPAPVVSSPPFIPPPPLPPVAASVPRPAVAAYAAPVAPRPTATPFPLRRMRRRRRPRRTPVPTRTPGILAQPTVVLRQSVQNALGCLSSAPEPFAEGGAYIEFCLYHAARVRIEIFDASGMKLWSSEIRALAPVSQYQWWFDGTADGKPLEPGSYLFEITADYGDGMSESRQGSMTRGRDRS